METSRPDNWTNIWNHRYPQGMWFLCPFFTPSCVLNLLCLRWELWWSSLLETTKTCRCLIYCFTSQHLPGTTFLVVGRRRRKVCIYCRKTLQVGHTHVETRLPWKWEGDRKWRCPPPGGSSQLTTFQRGSEHSIGTSGDQSQACHG